eukprot:symbB.v1.2.037168.t1/scaffold5410.1/size27443/1
MALSAFHLLRGFHGTFDVVSYSAVISALEKGQKWQLAIDMLRHFQRTSGRLDVVIYNATISACEKSTAWWAALHFLAEVVASDLQRTLIGYTSASSACSKAMQWVAALQLLEDHEAEALEPTELHHLLQRVGCVDSFAAKRRRNTGERAIRVQRHKQRPDTREGGEASKDALSEAPVPGELSVPADGPRPTGLRPVLVASTEESGSGAMKVTRPPIPPPRPRREEVSGPEEEMMAPKVLSPTAAEDGKISFYSMAKKPEITKVEASSEHTASKSSDEEDDPDEESDFSDLEVDIKTEMPKDDEQDQGARKEKDHADEQPVPSSTRDQDMPKEEQASEPRDRGSESEKEEDFSCVYFHNVPFEVYEEDLLPLFERAGAVRAMRLFRLGQGLCQFTSSGAASKAVQILAGCFLANPLNETSKDSRELFVKIHQGSTDILNSSKVVSSNEQDSKTKSASACGRMPYF